MLLSSRPCRYITTTYYDLFASEILTLAFFFFFFFNDTATTEIYTLSLHDALPICLGLAIAKRLIQAHRGKIWVESESRAGRDRKSTRLNSSHPSISYAVFCLKKKKKKQ